MVKQIIKEAMEKNPIGLKEAVEAELMGRLRVALESKKNICMGDEDLGEAAQDTYRISISGKGGATVRGSNEKQAIDRALSKLKISKSERRPYISGIKRKDVKIQKQ